MSCNYPVIRGQLSKFLVSRLGRAHLVSLQLSLSVQGVVVINLSTMMSMVYGTKTPGMFLYHKCLVPPI